VTIFRRAAAPARQAERARFRAPASLTSGTGDRERGAGYGLVGDLIIGIIGAFIGEWLMPRLGVHIGAGIVGEIIDATIGALLLLFVLRLVRGGGGWGGRWRGGGRWGRRW
jgi:uncharacterized membrane protein YeaQ/YmgE (transglycosylase-associated protein family)